MGKSPASLKKGAISLDFSPIFRDDRTNFMIYQVAKDGFDKITHILPQLQYCPRKI
jgi:hypothetical protein